MTNQTSDYSPENVNIIFFWYDCLYDSNEVLSDYQGLSGSYYLLCLFMTFSCRATFMNHFMNTSKDYILGYWSIQIQLLIEINVVSFNNNSIISYFQFSDENRTQNILIKQLTVLNRFVLIVVFDIIIVALWEFNDIAKWMVKEKRRIHMHLLENEI